jgi:hypothetical protein
VRKNVTDGGTTRQAFRVVGLPEVEQPSLPRGFRWKGEAFAFPRATREWWEHWADSPLIDGFTKHDWDFLKDTAIIHAMFHLGLSEKAAGELRTRLAKFGVTPEDRAKLRITTVNADSAEESLDRARELKAKVKDIGTGRRLTAI